MVLQKRLEIIFKTQKKINKIEFGGRPVYIGEFVLSEKL